MILSKKTNTWKIGDGSNISFWDDKGNSSIIVDFIC